MIKLYDSAFSPFARKVRMVLEYKGLADARYALHPAFLDARGTRRTATGPELGAGHRARHHGRQFVADHRRRGRHADRRPFGG